MSLAVLSAACNLQPAADLKPPRGSHLLEPQIGNTKKHKATSSTSKTKSESNNQRPTGSTEIDSCDLIKQENNNNKLIANMSKLLPPVGNLEHQHQHQHHHQRRQQVVREGKSARLWRRRQGELANKAQTASLRSCQARRKRQLYSLDVMRLGEPTGSSARTTTTKTSKLEAISLSKCSPIIKQIFIYTLITSSILAVFEQASASTNFYLPLSRRIHHSATTSAPIDGGEQQVQQHRANKQQVAPAISGAAADYGTALGPPKRHKLLIGQHYSNFTSVVPYSLFQDADPDYEPPEDLAGQAEPTYPVGLDATSSQLAAISAAAIAAAIAGQQHQHQHLHHHMEQQQVVQLQDNNNHHHHQQPQLLIGSGESGSNLYAGQLGAVGMAIGGELASQSAASSLSKRLEGFEQVEADGLNGAETTDIGAKLSRALLPLDSNRLRLPQMQQIKARFNQGCVGGTKCQFFAFCWMSGGSLGASCGLLMTCCVTPSRQEIQPGFYGPVVNDPYCGRSTSKINRIVGGTDASFGQFPWQAFVQVGGSRCGGALISSRHVVTAGHCVARSQHSPSSIKVTLGDYILNSDIESIPHEVFSVVEVLLHPNFRFTPQADRYDVAVLELDRKANYKDNIKPICLPQKDAAFVGRVAYVAGWGALQAGSKLRPKVLQHVAVPVIENQVCEGWHRRKGIDIRIYDEMMCAGYELGQRDACQGDSGGPLMLNQFGVWYLVGIVSAGYSCAKQYQPGIYHRVSSSSDWISSNVYQHQHQAAAATGATGN